MMDSSHGGSAFSSFQWSLIMSQYQNDIQVGRVGIIGANAIGIGIAASLLDAGVPVTLFELERESLDRGIALARPQPDGRDRRTALLAGTVNFHHLKDCDLIVDAVDADTAGKEKLFRRLDQVAKPGAVLMTLASDASVDRIAGCTRRPGDVLGLHVAHSPTTGEKWQIVRGKGTSDQTLDTVTALARKLPRLPAVSGLGHHVAADANGAASWEIDRALD
jgi:3-hydroxyacyl-CoA dehydrogenase